MGAIGFGVSMLVTLGQKERAMEWATRAHLVDPENANLQYNLACAMSMLGERARALDILEDVASRSSQGMLSWMETDSDLDSIRDDARYAAMIERASARLSAKAAAAAG